jgi:GWxTD domain-containing protein
MKYLSGLYVPVLFLLISCGSQRPAAPIQQLINPKPIQPEVIMLYDYYTQNDSVYFFARFEDARQVLDMAQASLRLEYTLRAGASDKSPVVARDTLQIGEQGLEADPSLYFNFSIDKSYLSEPNTLQLRLWQKISSQERMAALYTIVLRPEMQHKDFLLLNVATGKPLVRRYANASEPLLLQQFGEPRAISMQQFEETFTPALVPMSMRQIPPPRTIKVLRTLNFMNGDTIRLNEQGLYMIEPGATFKGGLLVKENEYPLLTTAKELIEPLIYITTAKERAELMKAADPKAAVDNFWLKVAGDKNIARSLIKAYYGRVEGANRLFTSHKAGWTTDRGMIYIVYGQPDNITLTADSETWLYRHTELTPPVKFVFNKKQNNFTENHYELIRRPEYEESWYSTVAKWRAGITDSM